MNKKLLTLISFIFCMYAGETSFAQSCTIDQSFTGIDTRESIVGSDTTLPDGQSFTAGITGALYSVSLDIGASNPGCTLTTMDVRVDILDGDSIDGAQLASQVYTLPVDITRALDTFSFDTPAIVTAGQMYTITFTLLPSQSCGMSEPNLVWYFEFPTNFWTNTGGVQYYNGVIASLGNTQYFTTCVGSPVGVFEGEKETVTINAFPNPFTQNLTVTTENEMKNITITNVLGEIVYAVQANGTKKGINLSALNPGIYLVDVETMQGMETLKLIKQ